MKAEPTLQREMRPGDAESSRVTVLLPTAGQRPDSLARAIRSALFEDAVAEVIVLVDGDAPTSVPDDPRCSLIRRPRTGSPGALRAFGAEVASTDWIAYLDDDDAIVAGGLEPQLEFAQAGGFDVVSCRSDLVDERGAVVAAGVPRDLFVRGQPVDDYLFTRRRLGLDRNSLFTPTLVVRRSVAEEVGWRACGRHLDWEFLLRVAAAGYSIGVADHVGRRISVPSGTGISANTDWRSSIAFFDRVEPLLSARAATEFLFSQPLRFALEDRSVEGVREVFRRRPVRSRPSPASTFIGLSGLAGGASRSAAVGIERLKASLPGR